MFAAVLLDDHNQPYYINLKLEPIAGELMRQQYPDIIGYHSRILQQQAALEFRQSGRRDSGRSAETLAGPLLRTGSEGLSETETAGDFGIIGLRDGLFHMSASCQRVHRL